MDLEEALEVFERVETNLTRLDRVLRQLDLLTPDGIVFGSTEPEALKYEDLRRSFSDLLTGLRPLDGFVPNSEPMALDDIAQWRLDAFEVGEPGMSIGLSERISQPHEELSEYKHRFAKARRSLVRERTRVLMDDIENILIDVGQNTPRDTTPMSDNDEWQSLSSGIAEIERLLGPDLVKSSERWQDLQRHLNFAQGVDFNDIAVHDWPSVRADIEASLYTELEPVPVGVDDLSTLVESKPQGGVSTALSWEVLDDEAFERLIFDLLSNAAGYENVQWLTKTRAPDQGRDLSADRVVHDSLSGTRRERVIVQCRHWLSRSLSDADCAAVVAKMKHWEPPKVDTLIIATTGHFTTDGIHWIENHNQTDAPPTVEMWNRNLLESLLASRAAVVEALGLRK